MGGEIPPWHLGTTAVSVVASAVLLILAPGLPLTAGLLALVAVLAGLRYAAVPGRLRLRAKGRGLPFGHLDGLGLVAVAGMPLMVAGVVLFGS